MKKIPPKTALKKPSPTTLKPGNAKPGAVRIITGAWRGRSIEVPPGQLIRPTADRVRQALFNRLAHAFAESVFKLTGADIVDVFAGTGALGLEALSRGAAQCTFIDRNPEVVALLKRNVAKLGAEDRAVVMNADGAHLPRAAATFDLAFLDPPYGEGLVTPALLGLDRQGWLKPGGLVAVETDAGDPEPAAENFTLVDRRTYGRVAVSFLSYKT